MNEKGQNSLISEKNTEESSLKDADTAAISVQRRDGEQTPSRSTYESFYWLLCYIKLFTTRLAKDVFLSLLSYFYSGQIIPNHIVDLMRMQKNLRAECETLTVTCSSSRDHRIHSLRLLMSKYFNALKSYILSSEDDIGMQCTTTKDLTHSSVDREPMFVIVDSSCDSNPSSKELLIDNITNPREEWIKYYHKNVLPIDVPSTSKDQRHEIFASQLKESESGDELQMIDINLQSENDIPLRDNDYENESIVISYLRNKDAFLKAEGTILSTKKKASLLESVPKMETILEGEQFTTFPINVPEYVLSSESQKLSETSLDVYIPSYPGSPRSLTIGSFESLISDGETETTLRQAVEFFHHDNEFLIAAEIGDDKTLEIIISKGTNIQETDHLGRNALHLAVCSDNEQTIIMLLNLGVNPNVKDNVGMTPLSLCLMRRPSLSVANLLFNHGARILPRVSPMDTGLFLQFVMMCTPTTEEEKILRLLVKKGSLVNDPEAPGRRQALHFAAMSNNCKLITILDDLGADLYAFNHRNETPKNVAFTFQCKEAYILLEQLEELDNPTGATVIDDASASISKINYTLNN